MRNIGKFFNLSFTEKKMLFEALVFALFYRTVTNILTFKRWEHFLGKQAQQPDNEYTTTNMPTLRHIANTLNRVNNILPVRQKCLIDAMVGRQLLIRRKLDATIYLGAMRNKQTIIAHAWLKSGGHTVSGGRNSRKFKPLKAYA